MYTSASEVVREALRLMEEQDRLRAAKLEHLREDIRKGMDSGPSESGMRWMWNRQARARRSGKAKAGQSASQDLSPRCPRGDPSSPRRGPAYAGVLPADRGGMP